MTSDTACWVWCAVYERVPAAYRAYDNRGGGTPPYSPRGLSPPRYSPRSITPTPQLNFGPSFTGTVRETPVWKVCVPGSCGWRRRREMPPVRHVLKRN